MDTVDLEFVYNQFLKHLKRLELRRKQQAKTVTQREKLSDEKFEDEECELLIEMFGLRDDDQEA